MASFTLTITPPVAAGRGLRFELEVDPRVLTAALARVFPVSPSLPIPTMHAPAQASTNGGKQKLTEKSCAWCGNLFRGRPERKYHSAACQAKAKQHRAAEKAAAKNGQATV